MSVSHINRYNDLNTLVHKQKEQALLYQQVIYSTLLIE